MKLEGKTVLITGASRGIGLSVARLCAEAGAHLALVSKRGQWEPETLNELQTHKNAVHTYQWDLTDTVQLAIQLAQIEKEVGQIDVLINNAGANVPYSEDTDAELRWRTIFDTNLKALCLLTESVVTNMAARKSGVVVNVASDVGLCGASSYYGLSKSGVVAFTKGMAQKWAAHGVRINAVAPGPVATDMQAGKPGLKEKAVELPLGRLSSPGEVARIIVFLASEDAAAIFGQVIAVNSKIALSL